MSSMMDIFNNTTSLAIIAILLLVIGLCFLFVYIEYVKRDQNHKIASMLSLVTSITEEVQSIRNFMAVITSGNVNHISVSNGRQGFDDSVEENTIQRVNASDVYDIKQNDLIEVSDGEEEEEEEEDINEIQDEDDDDDLGEDEDENLEENEEYNDSEIEDLEYDGAENEDIDCEPTEESVFKLNNESSELESLVVEDEVVTDLTDVADFTDFKDVVDVTNVADVKEEVEVKPETINLEEQPSVITQYQKDLFKTISITSVEDDGIRIVETQDYKKMSLPKLKQVAVEKKLVADASKLKKHDILKLLGVEL